ncbi:hypothetical protein [Algoriella sp.]|uniref:hypothetical protein n=1 Tax=Algoriella sp. TaxID=1872434 RepID=UPI002FC98121
METKSIIKYSSIVIGVFIYLWMIGESFAHISVFLAYGLMLIGILILIINRWVKKS